MYMQVDEVGLRLKPARRASKRSNTAAVAGLISQVSFQALRLFNRDATRWRPNEDQYRNTVI
jgi:hypothetical protein